MSNLTLKATDWASLAKLAKNGETKKLGYNTTVENVDGTMFIRHHDNIIAALSPDGSFTISNAGWGSVTTRDRLNRILRSNGVRFGITQKNFVQVLFQHGTDDRWENFESAEFNTDGQLTRFNGIGLGISVG